MVCNNMNVNEEINVSATEFNELYTFALHSIRRILNDTNVEKITWHTTSGKNNAVDFVNLLYDAGLALLKKNHSIMGNFVLTGKQGFEILKKIGDHRCIFEEDQCVIDSTMNVKYIPSIDDNMFIVSVYEPLNFKYDDDYKKYYEKFPNIEAIVVGDIVDDSCNKNIEEKSKTCNNKHDAVASNYIKCYSKTHLIFGASCCGKTSLFRQIVREKLNIGEDVFVFGNEFYGKLYFNDKSNNRLHFYSPKDVCCFSNEVEPKCLAEYIINYCNLVSCKDNIRTIAIDGFEQFKLNKDYTTFEYFRELSKACRIHGINFMYVLRFNTDDKKETYHKLPEIYERFSDIITVLK